MFVSKVENTVFEAKKSFSKPAQKINMPTQSYNQYTEKRVEQIIKTAKEQLEVNPRNELELLAMIQNVGFNKVLDYLKRHSTKV